jgi:hypothetical protein
MFCEIYNAVHSIWVLFEMDHSVHPFSSLETMYVLCMGTPPIMQYFYALKLYKYNNVICI